MRLAKTLDSVEMLRKKRKSQDFKFVKRMFSADSDQVSEGLDED